MQSDFPLGIVNNPLTNSVFTRNDSGSAVEPPPSTDNWYTSEGDNVITNNGDMIIFQID